MTIELEISPAQPVRQRETTRQARADIVASLRNVSKSFGERTLFAGIELEFRRGEFVALLGASGSGKTTLLRILAALDNASSGTVEVAANRAVVFQEARLLPFKRVWKNVALGTRLGRDQVASVLADVGLERHVDAWPQRLSGGEAQRVALARALVRQPDLLLLDEPFAALDALTRIRMHALIKDLCARYHPATLLVTHDVDEAILLADRVLVLKDQDFSISIPTEASVYRDRGSAEFLSLRARLLEELGVSAD